MFDVAESWRMLRCSFKKCLLQHMTFPFPMLGTSGASLTLDGSNEIKQAYPPGFIQCHLREQVVFEKECQK